MRCTRTQMGALCLATLLLVVTGCFEDKDKAPPQQKPTAPNKSVPGSVSSAPVNQTTDPVSDHWTETGHQGLDGKTCSTWWNLSGQAPAAFFQKAAAYAKTTRPAGGFTQVNATTAHYSMPIEKNLFGEVRNAEVTLTTAASAAGTPCAQFQAAIRAEDLSEASKTAKQEAERLCLATRGDTVALPSAGTPAKVPLQTGPAPQPPVSCSALPNYGIPDKVINEIGEAFKNCQYGNPFTSSFGDEPDPRFAPLAELAIPGQNYKTFSFSPFLTTKPQQQLFLLTKQMGFIAPEITGEGTGRFSIDIFNTLFTSQAIPRSVYRQFSFPSVGLLQKTPQKNLIILIHGWNPTDDKNPFSSPTWSNLVENLKKVVGPEWGIVEYNWAADAATGPAPSAAHIVDSVLGAETIVCENETQITNADGLGNGCKAAAVGHLHGYKLGELLCTICPKNGVRRVHFIAHSAGTWVARNAARALLAKTANIQVQVTLLDPFMPKESQQPGAVLGTSNVSDLAKDSNGNPWPQGKLYLLENYFVKEDATGCGTEQMFAWRRSPPDINQQLDAPLVVPYSTEYTSKQKQAYDTDGNRIQGQNLISAGKRDLTPSFQNGHGLPIQFYADSIVGANKVPALQGLGWPLSMAAQSKVAK